MTHQGFPEYQCGYLEETQTKELSEESAFCVKGGITYPSLFFFVTVTFLTQAQALCVKQNKITVSKQTEGTAFGMTTARRNPDPSCPTHLSWSPVTHGTD